MTPRPLLERDIERYLVAQVKAAGGEVRKVKWLGRDSAPDRVVMLPESRLYWVELKNPQTVLTFPADARERAQAREHRRMRAVGQVVCVAGTLEQVDALLARRGKVPQLPQLPQLPQPPKIRTGCACGPDGCSDRVSCPRGGAA